MGCMGTRKVVLYELLSIDGVAEEPGDWLFDMDEVYRSNLADVIGRQDDVLLGRRTYDEWAGYWPGSTIQPFADFINGTPKHVVTATTPSVGWSSSTLVEAPVTFHVADLKRRAGRDIGVHGSITLARSLLRAGLVDELRLVVAPTLAGRGRRLFDAAGTRQRFALADAQRTPSGLALLAYEKRA